MGRPECDGYIGSLLDEKVLCTGKTYIDGEWMKRPELHRAINAAGGRPMNGTRNASVTVLVVGDLPNSVTDPIYLRSQSLVLAEKQRGNGHHVCIVDDNGISALLRGGEAPCLRSRAVESGEIELSLPPPRKPSKPRLVPLGVMAAPTHDATRLELDLSGLDRGTAAHQETLSRLATALLPTVAMGLSSPQVDAAWRAGHRPGVLAIAEVKSLTGRRQDQQIRLGIGQLLDYTAAVRAHPPEGITEVRPFLVLEKEPENPGRWEAVAAVAGVDIVWGPEFSGLPRQMS